MGILKNKKALVVGVASNRSIAWAIAEALHREGAELAFTYQNEKLKNRVEKIAAATGSQLVLPCDVSSDEQIQSVFDTIGQQWDGLDIVIHSVGFAPRELLQGNYVDSVTREGFLTTMDISAYSFVALAKAGRELMRGRNGSLLTLSYLGSMRAMENYNVMGVAKAALEASVRYMAHSLGPEGTRVNAISAGAIKTLAASGIGDFRKMLEYMKNNSALRRNVTQEDVANTAAFLCSDWARGITGEILYVDSGYNIMGPVDLGK